MKLLLMILMILWDMVGKGSTEIYRDLFQLEFPFSINATNKLIILASLSLPILILL